jgi:hypothetical protein
MGSIGAAAMSTPLMVDPQSLQLNQLEIPSSSETTGSEEINQQISF